MYLDLVRLGSFYREFGVGLLVRPLTLWEMCKLSRESGANFGELAPCLGIVNHGATTLGLETIF